ncbi:MULTISPECIES: CcmD family protein [Haloplanus]|jgi:CcmD family protein|uniref:CcmD family protein n=2 Tax=Haloplanus TaxID=376170 RepID=A0A345E7K5_9EURY|nr:MULTISPECIES: CcmD family protein [Haloplanus]AXG08177.1 CcmD family protein [Haloplanus rubicundus]AXG11892.1 CcmD family protein [Haloplanus rubicundus]AZH26370.1 CcmD family protein [Haloplanus aerogenes]RMB18166.1 CcmD family protein [Haloplanus aerogenes]
MEPLLLFGYTALFVALFGYVTYLQRRLGRLERQLNDAR